MSWHAQRLLPLAMVTITVAFLPTATQRLMSSSSQVAMTGPLARLPTVAGDNAALHCDTRPTEPKDTMLLVVWYRDEEPVYSFDTRKTGPSAYWIEESIQGRAQWAEVPTPSLHLQRVQPGDRAVYRCRVDFLKSPTKNYWIALDVIELPRKPKILDEYNKEINNVAGPYKEGSDFKLICTVEGGIPYPRVQWFRGDSALMTLPGGDLESESVASPRYLVLEVTNASRAHHSATYTCTADNTVLAPPQRTTVRVDMYLRPLTVEILYRELPLSVGRKAELWCRSTGARPPANITWWLNGELLYSESKYLEVEGRNETLSRLEWTPAKHQNGKVLVCKAEHTEFHSAVLEAKLPLNIYYTPESTMRLGAKMNPNDIEEGDDVYFECEVDANPPAYKVIWEHNGLQLQHNPSNGVILTANTNLALRNITRHQAGNYTCTASNVEGDGKSRPLPMQVVYKPLCTNAEMKLIGAALQEPTAIVCLVEAFPPPNTFDWILNNSMGSIKVDSGNTYKDSEKSRLPLRSWPHLFTARWKQQRYTVEAKEGKSVLTYTPVADVDYGTLSCRASNMAGQQVAPCVYTLLPATRPDPPTNCTVYNLTDDALDLTCLPGYEGGLQNVYLAEVWAPEGLVVNASNGVAVWNLRRLGAKRQLRFVVYAANARGRSEHVTFTVTTPPRQSPRTEAQEAWEMNWALGGVLGAGIAVAAILCLAFIATRLRHRSRDYGVAVQSTKNLKAHQKGASPDDCNPDIIPLSKETSESQPEPPKYSAVVGRPESKNSSSSHSIARPQSPTPLPPYSPQSEMQSRNCANGAQRSHREIVTTRTPLLTAQESRV